MEAFLAGLERAFALSSLGAILLGSVIGYVFGFIPGLQSVTAMVLIMPFTYGWDPITGMYVFAGIIGAAGNGGAVTSIALNMPGTVVNVATSLDGYPLAQQGKGSWALGVASGTAFLGAMFGLVTLMAVIPIFMPFLMAFGPAEVFWVLFFGVATMAFALPGSFMRSMISVGAGILVATVGFGGMAIAFPRFTFGSVYLMYGFDLVTIVIGFLVVSEAIMNLAHYHAAGAAAAVRLKAAIAGSAMQRWKDGLAGMLVPLRYPGLLIRGSAIGTLIGAIPGVGGAVAQFFAYNTAYALSKNKEQFGKGSVEGLIAAQAAVDAKEGGTVLPTLVFGIPGNSEMALVLAAWELHGLQTGIFFMRDHADVAWALILGLIIANGMATLMMMLCLPIVSYIPLIRDDFVAVAVMVVSMLAAYSIRQNLWDAGVVIFAGLAGYLVKSLGYSVIGLVVGFILGGMMESTFHTALQSGLGSYRIFVSSTLSTVLMVATVLVVVLAIARKLPALARLRARA